jgi:tetratricopeptide (TPR) repeat protein
MRQLVHKFIVLVWTTMGILCASSNGSAGTKANLTAKIKEASKLEAKRDHSGVTKLLRPEIDELPREGLLILARAYEQMSDPAMRIRVLELCLAKNPQDHIVQTQLGYAYNQAKRWDESMTAFMNAKTMNPGYRPAYDGILQEFERSGDRYEARALLSDMLKRFGPEPKLYTALCRLYSLDNFLEKSIEICETAIAKAPQEPSNYVYLATSLQDSEQKARANLILEAATRKFPRAEAVQSTAADMKLVDKDYASAYRLFRQAVVADAKSARAHLGLGNSAFALQKHSEALEAFIAACKLDRKLSKEFRIAARKLRDRSESSWAARFDEGLSQCQ